VLRKHTKKKIANVTGAPLAITSLTSPIDR
jgi:hypothetical protein